jgi:hypothetical protein
MRNRRKTHLSKVVYGCVCMCKTRFSLTYKSSDKEENEKTWFLVKDIQVCFSMNRNGWLVE